MKANIKLDLKSLTPVRLLCLLRHVASSMEGNPSYPAPPVSPATLVAMADAFDLTILDAIAGSRQSKLVRNARDKEVRAALRQSADYVRMVAQGDASMLHSSGFELAKVPGASQPMEAPRMKHVEMTGRDGEVLLRWSGVANRRSYQVYMTDKDPALPDTQWTLITITGGVKYSVTGLKAYEPYWFCVSAVGALGESIKSGAIIGRAA